MNTPDSDASLYCAGASQRKEAKEAMSSYAQTALARQGGLPDAPATLPPLGFLDRCLSTVLPSMLCPAWKLDELYVCRLSTLRALQARDDLQIQYFTGIEKVPPELLDLVWKGKDFLTRRLWKYRLKRRYCWLVVAYLAGRPVRYAFTQYAGGGMIPYRPVMRPRSALIGPSMNIDPSVRVEDVAPYLQSWILHQLKLRGYQWAYIGVNVENQPLRDAVRRTGVWTLVGRLLLRRSLLDRFHIQAATLGPNI